MLYRMIVSALGLAAAGGLMWLALQGMKDIAGLLAAATGSY